MYTKLYVRKSDQISILGEGEGFHIHNNLLQKYILSRCLLKRKIYKQMNAIILSQLGNYV